MFVLISGSKGALTLLLFLLSGEKIEFQMLLLL
jgi:hypothetical protein